jgi:hypothetical protein
VSERHGGHRGREERPGHRGVAELFGDESEVEQLSSEPSRRFGDDDRSGAELGKTVP